MVSLWIHSMWLTSDVITRAPSAQLARTDSGGVAMVTADGDPVTTQNAWGWSEEEKVAVLPALDRTSTNCPTERIRICSD